MTIKELRSSAYPNETLCIQEYGNAQRVLALNENRCIDDKYDSCEVVKISSQRYPAISSIGITVEINYCE